MEKRVRSYTVGGNVSWDTVTTENKMEVLQKTKNRVAILSSNPSPRHIPGESPHLERHMYPKVHNSTTYKSQDMVTT